jgi:hypothetical protein
MMLGSIALPARRSGAFWALPTRFFRLAVPFPG